MSLVICVGSVTCVMSVTVIVPGLKVELSLESLVCVILVCVSLILLESPSILVSDSDGKFVCNDKSSILM